MNYDVFKLNNYVVYNGKVNNNYGRVGLITSVERMNDEDTFELKILKQYPGEEERVIRAYMGELTPIPLTKQHLTNVGFEFNEQTRLFSREDVTICRPMFIKDTQDMFGNSGRLWDDKGFRVIKDHIDNFGNEDEVLEKSISVYFVNSLQNFYEAQKHIQLEGIL